MSEKTKVAAIDGWFEGIDGSPQLIGSRCESCGTYGFPKETVFCKNPACSGTSFAEVPMSSRGKLWSFTNNCYPPPAPYVSPDPFVPYIVAAVELEKEKMVVLGQVAGNVAISDLKAGMEMQLTVDTLYEDDDNEYVVWKWTPAG